MKEEKKVEVEKEIKEKNSDVAITLGATKILISLFFVSGFIVKEIHYELVAIYFMVEFIEIVCKYRKEKKREDLLGIIGTGLISIGACILYICSIFGKI